ncbi:MAG: hypothetical protein WCK35_07575 [Chloroflexota bacterium]
MTEFTSLICPNCGGTLNAEIGVLALRCSYCGTQHAIKDDLGLSTFIPEAAVCPVCWKSDRVGSLPSILTHPTEGEREQYTRSAELYRSMPMFALKLSIARIP